MRPGMFREVPEVRVAGGLCPWLVQWKIRPEGTVKTRTCQVCQAKKLVLYSGGNGESHKVLENECDLIRALPWRRGRQTGRGSHENEFLIHSCICSSIRNHLPHCQAQSPMQRFVLDFRNHTSRSGTGPHFLAHPTLLFSQAARSHPGPHPRLGSSPSRHSMSFSRGFLTDSQAEKDPETLLRLGQGQEGFKSRMGGTECRDKEVERRMEGTEGGREGSWGEGGKGAWVEKWITRWTRRFSRVEHSRTGVPRNPFQEHSPMYLLQNTS